ncbi:hypothetical protein [Agromyces sp. GXQ0307]|uniref:hypothetical protein n=1 Tax=unclassified Agromyces TaxID=2639701 RepID=UPI00383BE85C
MTTQTQTPEPRPYWKGEQQADGTWQEVPDWDAINAARIADGADVPGIVTRDSLLINADMATLWKQRTRKHPRERFVVELTPNGSRIRAA